MNIATRGSSNPCNCAAKPDLPSGGQWGKITDNAYTCNGGCQFTPRGPSVSQPDLSGNAPGQTVIYDGGAGWRPTGAECNPITPPVQESGPTPDPNCDDDVCVSAPNPPDFCVEVDGKQICAPSDQGPCHGNPSDGYLCVGNPPEEPPPPPATKPDPDNPTEPAPPDEEGGPVSHCNGAGSCTTNNWHYHEGGGGGSGGGDPGGGGDDDGEDDPPVDNPPGGLPGACPDGTMPQNGMCPAPATCPGGTTPVNGQCPSNQQCPIGTTVGTNGQCSDGSAPSVTCPGGATPNSNGTCPSTPNGTCPNGSQPVNGQCSITSTCDPLTDPNHCEQSNGNASGGQTCGAAPACSGDPILCMQVYQQWRTRCALDGLAVTGTPGDSDYGPSGTSDELWADGDGGEGTGGLDTGGWLGGDFGSSCPPLPTATFMSYTMVLADIIPCGVLHILSVLIATAGLIQGMYIVGRA